MPIILECQIDILDINLQKINAWPCRPTKPEYETEPNRDPVLRDQKVLPEVRNRPLLPRVFSSHPILWNTFWNTIWNTCQIFSWNTSWNTVWYTIWSALWITSRTISWNISWTTFWNTSSNTSRIISWNTIWNTIWNTFLHTVWKNTIQINPHPQPPYQASAWSYR